jgi:hypothetical protein
MATTLEVCRLVTEPAHRPVSTSLEVHLKAFGDHASRRIPGASLKRVRILPVRCSLLAFALSAAGCTTYWGQRPLDQPTPVEPNYPVWIWSRSAVNKWYAVRITQDSVSGIPFEMPMTCDSCRHSLPRTQVDSMKVAYMGYHTTAKDVIEGVGVVTAAVTAGLFLEYVLCSALHERNGC